MKDLKILILFIVVLSGCSKKYLASREEKLLDRSALAAWEELDCRIIEKKDNGFSLNFQIRNFIEVRDSVKAGELYERGSGGGGDIMAILGAVIGLGGLIGGCSYAESTDLVNDTYKIPGGCIISCVSVFLGAAMISRGSSQEGKFVKVLPGHKIRRDTVCIDSVFPVKKKMKVGVEELDFEKIYCTDKNGIVEVKFDELFSEPSEVDSVLSIIIKYEKMVDTVNVKRL